MDDPENEMKIVMKTYPDKQTSQIVFETKRILVTPYRDILHPYIGRKKSHLTQESSYIERET